MNDKNRESTKKYDVARAGTGELILHRVHKKEASSFLIHNYCMVILIFTIFLYMNYVDSCQLNY